MSLWFRFYSEVLNDPKVQSLPADMFKAWVNMLCVASEHGGYLPDNDTLAFHLRVENETLIAFQKAFHARGLLDLNGRGYKMHGWDKRQFKSDTSTDRVKRFRKRFNGVPVTPPETDTESETDTPTSVGVNARMTREDFEAGVWQDFPKNPGSNKSRAWSLFSALTYAEQIACMRGVARLALRFEEAPTDEPVDKRLKYHQHLSNWIAERGWEAELAE